MLFLYLAYEKTKQETSKHKNSQTWGVPRCDTVADNILHFVEMHIWFSSSLITVSILAVGLWGGKIHLSPWFCLFCCFDSVTFSQETYWPFSTLSFVDTLLCSFWRHFTFSPLSLNILLCFHSPVLLESVFGTCIFPSKCDVQTWTEEIDYSTVFLSVYNSVSLTLFIQKKHQLFLMSVLQKRYWQESSQHSFLVLKIRFLHFWCDLCYIPHQTFSTIWVPLPNSWPSLIY